MHRGLRLLHGTGKLETSLCRDLAVNRWMAGRVLADFSLCRAQAASRSRVRRKNLIASEIIMKLLTVTSLIAALTAATALAAAPLEPVTSQSGPRAAVDSKPVAMSASADAHAITATPVVKGQSKVAAVPMDEADAPAVRGWMLAVLALLGIWVADRVRTRMASARHDIRTVHVGSPLARVSGE